MGIKNVLQNGVIFAVAMVAVFGLSLESALASEMKMRQQILPVRFVYLEKNGSIDHVWSNVTEKDDEYVVKFFDKKQKEILPDKRLLLKYIEKNKETAVSKQRTQETQIIEKNGEIEEIKTIV